MIESVSGRLAQCGPTYAVVETGGIGLRLTIPFSTYERIHGKENVTLLAHLHVQQDLMRLYGFATPEERNAFVLLIGVSQIGPAMAIRILSGTGVAELKQAIVEENLRFLEKIKGVGHKTAQRLVVELKEGIARLTLSADTPERLQQRTLNADVVEALVSLGDRKSEAEAAVREALKGFPAGGEAGELLRRALQCRGAAHRG
ncbi:MAG: Holliday junction branch migration protein RuvA [Planctomycetota bacterium]|nr:Holliday junction branch migration protein RuvA [Planctomycetota bacterium]